MKSEIENRKSKMVLTLDIGTSSLRAMLFDAQARPVDGVESQVKYKMRTTPDGGNETDADKMLRHAEHAIDRVLDKAGKRAKHIVAVASDSLVSNILGVDTNGQAVTPVFTYADTRCARQVVELQSQLDERGTHQRVGTLFHTSYQPARFLWLSREHADMFKCARYWMSLGEYCLFRWTGQRACSYSVASWTGLFNRRQLTWDAELLAALPITVDRLSPLVDHDTPVGPLRGEYATRWTLLRSAKWFPTVGDGAAANIGSGCVDATRIALTVGTTSALRVVTPTPTLPRFAGEGAVPWGLWAYRVDKDHELVGGALSEGGNLFSWMKHLFQLEDPTQIERELATLEPDAHGLTILPFLAGERAPNWNADARGAIVGLGLNTRPIEILRAGVESVAYRLGLIFELLHGAVPDAREVIASGGALMQSPVWMQIIADTLNAPVTASAEAEATSRGAALLALKALGMIQSLDDLPAQMGTTYQPDAARHEIYTRAMERQKKLYNQIIRNPQFTIGEHNDHTKQPRPTLHQHHALSRG